MPRDIPIERLRNLGIMAHVDAGKTTVSERILYYTGRIHRMGEVHAGTTRLDWMPQEREKGITITAAATRAAWAPLAGARRGARHEVTLVDTPGHVDFTIEVERSLRVLDGAVAVFDAAAGVEPQSETVWRQADRYHVPRIAFVNKMDRPGADFAMCVASIRERLGACPVPVQLPLGEEARHRGVVDLLRDRALVFDDADGREVTVVPVPADMAADVARARVALVEACADVDETVLAKYVHGGVGAVGEDDLERALRAGTLAFRLVPVLCGSALKNRGIQPLLDAVVGYLPSPADLPAVTGKVPSGAEAARPATDDASFCALAFKLMTDRSAGAVTFLRVYSGTLTAGQAVLNATRGERERVGRLAIVHADERTDVASAGAGTIVAALGLKNVRTGDTLCDPKHPIVLESLEVPEPVMELAVEPATSEDGERLALGLQRLALEDPSFRAATDEETGQTLVRGMGELHLEIIVDRLKREHRVAVTTGRPAVAYRETLTRAATVRHRYSKQSGGHGQFAEVEIEVAPNDRGGGMVFTDETKGGVIPREFVPAIERGVASAMSRGVLAGHPVVDVKVRLLDGARHVVDSSAAAFEVAGSLAFQEAAVLAGLCLLEPVMAVEVVTPEDFIGDVIGDLHARRGQVRGTSSRGGARVIDALVPLERLFGYVMDLRGRTQGRASATMRFAHYQQCPRAVEDAVVQKRRGR